MSINMKIRKPHQRNGRFYNYEGEPSHGFMYHTVRIWLRSLFHQKKESLIQPDQWKIAASVPKISMQPRITWIGHSTFLIQINGANILTDPIFGNVSPFFRRLAAPALSIEKLPRIDAIIISHNHWDHMDSKTLQRLLELSPECQILVPAGDQAWFHKRNIRRVYSCMWGEHQYVNVQRFDASVLKNVTTHMRFTFLPAYHWSQRGLFDRNKSLWGSWMIECDGYTLYFAGDTAYDTHFKEIAQHFPLIDGALLPIGPCEPHEWMKNTHMNAEQAAQAFLDLNARHLIPMHWGTFNFGYDEFALPLERVSQWWQSNQDKVQNKTLHSLRMGESIMLDQRATDLVHSLPQGQFISLAQ
jgi:L-ascorbate metabolism protein UlaG (beta-lactamase superfamily)